MAPYCDQSPYPLRVAPIIDWPLVKFFTAIDRYIFRLVLMPMLAVFVIAASLLVLDKMLKLFDFVATQGGPVGVVFRMLASMFPEYASLAIPLGLMLGVLMAFRRLATSSELDVMRAVGLSYTRLLRVPYMLAVVLACFNLVIVSYIQPLSRYYYEQLTFELSTGALGASIRVGEFNTLKDKMSLRIEQSRDEGRELPAGCVLLSSWLDLGLDRRTAPDLVRQDVILTPDWLAACARAYADPDAWADPLVSPLRAAHAGLPPLLIQAGTSELLAPDAELLAASASAAGVHVTYTRWPRMWHGFALQPGLLAAADSALAQAAWFIGHVTTRS